MATGQAIKGPKSAQTAQPGPSASTAEDKDNMEDAADGGADEAAEGEPAETNKEKPASDESAAIADSPEAKTHPHLALAAIKSGQTLAQFQATVVAVAGAPKVSKLDAALGGSPRLGADGQGQAAAEPKAINAGGYYQARAKAMGQRR